MTGKAIEHLDHLAEVRVLSFMGSFAYCRVTVPNAAPEHWVVPLALLPPSCGPSPDESPKLGDHVMYTQQVMPPAVQLLMSTLSNCPDAVFLSF